MKFDELLKEYHNSDTLNETYPDFFQVISAGRHCHASPDFFEASHLSCCLLLYPAGNPLTLSLAGGEAPVRMELCATSLTLLLPQTSFRLDALLPQSEFCFFAFTGKNIDYYLTDEVKKAGYYHQTDYPDSLLSCLRHIFDSSLQNSDARICHRYLTDFLTDFYLLQSKCSMTDATAIPTYLLEIKHYLNQSYMEPISLKQLENRSGYNQYRICRAFSQYFGISPLQYLNQIRLEKAKKLLLTSDFPVHEVGSMVGIDNTTHFINLFKRQEGMTPLAYRQRQES